MGHSVTKTRFGPCVGRTTKRCEYSYVRYGDIVFLLISVLPLRFNKKNELNRNHNKYAMTRPRTYML